LEDQWFYIVNGAQLGPVDLNRLGAMAQQGTLSRAAPVWRPGMTDWRPAAEVHPALFPVEQWFYMTAAGQTGPVDADGMTALVGTGAIQAQTPVWKAGMPEWLPAGHVLESFRIAPPPPGAGFGAPPPLKPGRSMIGGIAASISDAAELPTISNVPIRQILLGGINQAASLKEMHAEDEFAVGTRTTTPPLSQVQTGWPKLRVFWRVFFASVATYLLMRGGVEVFQNSNFFPGMVVVGSFAVPLSVVVMFFELNVPRNVSVYQVGKMTLLGGALSLVATMVVFQFVTGADAGPFIPSMLVGVGEELGKALALLVVAYNTRYRWQLNGLLFGAAVGAGFAGFESAGYAFNATQRGGLEAALSSITLRGLLAPGGHVIWTAMVGSAIWKVKGDQPFSIGMLLHPLVLRRYFIAVLLHGTWDWMLMPILNVWIKLALLIIVGWYLIFAILKQAMTEVEQEKARAVAA
jgi:RsiW-degrading membrane proteinase PrsW (M82 family)